MLAHESVFVHCFETKCENALALLRKLRGSGCVSRLRVLASSEACPARYFRDWRAHAVSRAKEDFEVDDDVDPCDLAWDVYTALLKINEQMLKRSATSLMQSAAADHVPSQEKLRAYLGCDKWFDLDDFLRFYDAPVHVELASEKVWPVPKFEKVTCYLED